jgi:transcriptional regulator with XRE-family HTH domain
VKLSHIVSDNVRYYRHKVGLTQEALAMKSMLHTDYIGRLERRQESISINNLEKIAKVLKVRPDLFLLPQGYKVDKDCIN